MLDIGGRQVGPGRPVYIIAEMSGNHNQQYDRAVRIVEAAKDAGADAVKLQTYTKDTITIDCDREFSHRTRFALGGSVALRAVRRGLHALVVAAEAQEDRR